MVNKSGNKLKDYTTYIVCAIILALLASVLTALRSPTGFLGYTMRIVVSGSMEPTIMTNTLNIIKVCDADDVEVNDIICYRYDRDIIHRVVDISNENGQLTITTKGDANKVNDDVHITDGMVIGKVVKTLNWTQYIIGKFAIAPGAFDSKAVYRVIVIGLILIMALSYLTKSLYEYIAICTCTFRGYTRAEQRVKRINNATDLLKAECSGVVKFSNEKIDNMPQTRITYIVHSLVLAFMEFRIKRLNEKLRNETKMMHKFMSFEKAVITFENEMDKKK